VELLERTIMHLDQILKTLVFVAFLSWTAPALAHGGEDHGPPEVALPTSSQPRAAAVSEDFEVVAVLKGAALLV
jgi:hypothetical protein